MIYHVCEMTSLAYSNVYPIRLNSSYDLGYLMEA